MHDFSSLCEHISRFCANSAKKNCGCTTVTFRNSDLKQFLPEVFFIEFSKLSERFAIGKYCNGKCNAFNILHVCSVR